MPDSYPPFDAAGNPRATRGPTAHGPAAALAPHVQAAISSIQRKELAPGVPAPTTPPAAPLAAHVQAKIAGPQPQGQPNSAQAWRTQAPPGLAAHVQAAIGVAQARPAAAALGMAPKPAGLPRLPLPTPLPRLRTEAPRQVGTIQPASMSSTPERLDVTSSYHPGGNSISAYALRLVGIPELYWRFIFPGGTVYRRTSTDPRTIFGRGWTRAGYDDLIKHTTVDQGKGSNWIATTKSLSGMDESYGTYAFEIELDWNQGVDVNVAYRTLMGSRNPHASQDEVAAYGTIRADQITAVWVPKNPSSVQTTQMGPTFFDYYDRFTPQSYLLARQVGTVTHPPS